MARSAEPIVLSEVERDELDPGSFDAATGGATRPNRPAGRHWDRQPGQRAPAGGYGSDGALLAAALGRRARPGAGRPIGRCAASGDTTDLPPEQICAILALACEPPEGSGVPITHWSQSALAREAVKRGLVETISHGSVGRFLKGG